MFDLLFPRSEETRPPPPSGPHTWGQLAPLTPFAAIFPDGRVPLQSIFAITPREPGSPPCYLVAVVHLTDAQIQALADLLWRQWRPECTSAAEAAQYIRSEGLPMRATWFQGLTTTRIGLVDLP